MKNKSMKNKSVSMSFKDINLKLSLKSKESVRDRVHMKSIDRCCDRT